MSPECLLLMPERINSEGWLEPAIHLPSPNFNSRPDSCDISLLVIHNISLPPSQFGGGHIESFFLNQLKVSEHPYFQSISDLKVSSHCLIARNGRITQFVPFTARAWHAGASCFDDIKDCNDYSIGIELEGDDTTPYTDEQYESLVLISKLILRCYPQVNVKRIVGHSDIAPGRKTDPGPAFDWSLYLDLLGVESCI